MNTFETLQSLAPSRLDRIYDVLEQAGHDVTQWHLTTNGEPEPDYSRNSRFRSRWSFVDDTGNVLLSMWYDMLQVEDGEIVIRGNARENQIEYARMGENYRHYRGDERRIEKSKKQRGQQWASKARILDHDIQQCHRLRVPFAVAIVLRDTAHEHEAEKAKARQLDPSKWYVHSYSLDGDYVLVRGERPRAENDKSSSSVVAETKHLSDETPSDTDATSASEMDIEDQFSSAPPALKESLVYPRDAALRRVVLLRSKGYCENCGEQGFLKENGRRYLETHHIVPLSEGGIDHPSNMIALCPNDHRKAHYGASKLILRSEYLSLVSSNK